MSPILVRLSLAWVVTLAACSDDPVARDAGAADTSEADVRLEPDAADASADCPPRWNLCEDGDGGLACFDPRDQCHCGGCGGGRCQDSSGCGLDGYCENDCPSPYAMCTGPGACGSDTPVCVWFEADPNHCGECGRRCAPDEDCINSECCPPDGCR